MESTVTRLCAFVICSLDVHKYCEMIWQNSAYKEIDTFKSPFISFTIRFVVNSVRFAISILYFCAGVSQFSSN